jgi:tripartite-type tricarboxylate transporter receptor subunit TctC
MNGRIGRRGAVALGLSVPWVAKAQAGAVTLVVPFAAGGPVDGVARLVARQMERLGGAPWVIDNRAGAGGTIGAQAVARAAPDGRTLLCASTGIVSIVPHVMDAPYDPLTAFTPLGMVGFSNGVLAVHPGVPARTVQELVAHARAHPNTLFFASAGNGTIAHLFGEMFRARAGIAIEHVAFRGSAPALADTIAGRTHMIFDVAALPAVREGQLRGLAVLGDAPSPLLPGLPPLRETGYGEQGVLSWFGLLGPAGLPAEIAARLAVQLGAALAERELAEGLERMGITARHQDATTFAATIRADHATFGAVVRRGNIRAS